jgi:Flp pilus assembly protein TadD
MSRRCFSALLILVVVLMLSNASGCAPLAHVNGALEPCGRPGETPLGQRPGQGEHIDEGKAEVRCESALRPSVRPSESEFHFGWGFLLDLLGHDDLATVEYSRAIEIDPRNDRYLNNRGNCYLLRGLPYLAVADFDRAIEINPRRPEAYYNRGRALEKMGRLSDADDDYRRAVELGICEKLPSLKICR